jgi:hypothetical protein
VPEELSRQRYGEKYNLILGDLYQTDDLRVLNYNSHSIMSKFSFREIGASYFHE